MQAKEVTSNRAEAAYLYDKLEERILARDQIGSSETYYDLLRAGRPVREIMAEGIRIHAPYTHVPYHERIDDGFVNFVNNDHCLLSARAGLHLAKMMPDRLAALPMAQTIWYIPTGLDIWNQKLGQALPATTPAPTRPSLAMSCRRRCSGRTRRPSASMGRCATG